MASRLRGREAEDGRAPACGGELVTRSLADSLNGHSPDRWAMDFLNAAGFPLSPANIQAVVSWEYAESGGGGGMYNPLNTTQGGYRGETDLNSVGVKNYASYDDGVRANARVIRNGFYGEAVALFQQGADARAICDSITRSRWGTGPIALLGVAAPTPAPPALPTFGDPPIMLANPRGGAWVARSDGVTFFAHPDGRVIRGGMISATDTRAFTGRTVRRLLSRRYGKLRRQRGYTIVADNGAHYVPENQR